MFFIDLFFALVIALILGSIFCVGCRGYRSRDGASGFFLVLFLVVWAAAIWVAPFGPLMWGAPWLVFVVVGLVFALLIAAIIPPAPSPKSSAEAVAQAREERTAAAIFNVFFWILLFILVITIAAKYLV